MKKDKKKKKSKQSDYVSEGKTKSLGEVSSSDKYKSS